MIPVGEAAFWNALMSLPTPSVAHTIMSELLHLWRLQLMGVAVPEKYTMYPSLSHWVCTRLLKAVNVSWPFSNPCFNLLILTCMTQTSSQLVCLP